MWGSRDRACSSMHRAWGTVRSWSWWMLSDLLLKPPVKQVSPAVTHPSAYLPSPLEVFFPNIWVNIPLKLVAPSLPLKDRGWLWFFSQPSVRKTLPPQRKFIHFFLVFPLETASSASLFFCLPPLGSINCFQHPPQSMLAKTGHVIPAQPHH